MIAAGCGSTSKIEICEKCCPRLDIGRRGMFPEIYQAVPNATNYYDTTNEIFYLEEKLYCLY